jgi:hypothetical protein
MPSLIKYSWPCLEVILEVANKQEKITYGELADRLGLQLAQQEWNTVLDSVAWSYIRYSGACWIRSGHDYCSLVDKRCRDFIHWIRVASA